MPRVCRRFPAVIGLILCLASVYAIAQTPPDDLAKRLVLAPSDAARQALLAQVTPDAALIRAIAQAARRAYAQGHPDEAQSSLQFALGLAQNRPAPNSEMYVRLGLGEIAYAQARNDQARAEYQQALTQAETARDLNAQAQAWAGLGLIERSQSRFDQALPMLEKALACARESNDKGLEAKYLNSLGTFYFVRGEQTRAEDFYTQARTLAESLQNQEVLASSLQNLGNIAMEKARYSDALALFQRALTLREGLGLVLGVADSLLSIGQVYRYQGNKQTALDYFQRSLPPRVQMRDKRGEALVLTNIGAIYYEQQEFARALSAMQRVLALREDFGDQTAIALTLNNISLCYDNLDDLPAAVDYATRALAIYENLNNPRGLVNTLTNLADLRSRQGRQTEATAMAVRAVELCRANNYIRLLWQTLTNLGLAYTAEQKYAEAQQAFSEAVTIIETIRAQSFGTEQESSNFFSEKLPAYKGLAYVLQQQKQDAAALSAAESAKSRVLLDVLRNGRAGINKALSEAERAREKQAMDALAQANIAYLKASRTKTPPSELTALRTRQETARNELNSLQTELYVAHPSLQAQRGEAAPITLAQIGELLTDTNTALLEYVVGSKHTMLLVITRDAGQTAPTLKVYVLPETEKVLASAADGLRRQLAQRDLGFQNAARNLYTRLIAPAAAQLKDKKSLIIVPDAGLWDLPFQALQNDAGRYVVEDYAVSYAPSLTVWREMKRIRNSTDKPKPNAVSLLAFGNPSLNANPKAKPTAKTPQLMSGTPSNLKEEAIPLPEAEKQVRELGQLYGTARSKIYLGPAALESRAKAESSAYRIVQFATHGILDDANPLNSYILLSQVGNPPDTDGRLEAREMMELDLSADLVILSACETARGKAGAGEGIIGMTWALFVAGAPATVASQWQVESASTTALMLAFHRQLQAKFKDTTTPLTTSEALRQAQLELLRSPAYRHPFYWAGFVLIGDEK